jgi:hypothetical protein
MQWKSSITFELVPTGYKQSKLSVDAKNGDSSGADVTLSDVLAGSDPALVTAAQISS